MDQQNHKLKLPISEVMLILLYSSMITFHHETFNVVTKILHIDGKLHFEKLTLHIYVYCCMYCMHFTLLISNVAGCGLFVDSAEASHFTHHTIFHIITVTSVYILLPRPFVSCWIFCLFFCFCWICLLLPQTALCSIANQP